VDGTSRLTKQERDCVPIAALPRRGVGGDDLVKAGAKLVFSTVPLLDEPVVVDPSRDPLGPAWGILDFVIKDVPNLGVDGILSIALNDALFVDVGHFIVFLRGHEGSANPGSFGTSGQNSRQGSAAGDATGG
jgi:hypothetical protein